MKLREADSFGAGWVTLSLGYGMVGGTLHVSAAAASESQLDL